MNLPYKIEMKDEIGEIIRDFSIKLSAKLMVTGKLDEDLYKYENELEQAILALKKKWLIEELKKSQTFLHGLTIQPENQHLFNVISKNNYNRINQLNGDK